MKIIRTTTLIWICALSTVLGQENTSASRLVKGPYLGQKQPGTKPVPFAPGLVTTGGWEYGGVFSPDMKEFYFLRQAAEPAKKQEFVVFKQQGGAWHETVISSRKGQPFVSPDGKTMHLGRRYMERRADGFSEVKPLGSPFQEIEIMRLTASSKGTYVFDEIGMPNGDGMIRYSRLKNGHRETPKEFGKEINTGRMNAHPFIAPDESYILWDGRREEGYGHSDIYISFRQKDGSWGEAINLGPQINTEGWEASATVTPDGKYLFFNRNANPGDSDGVDIYWVDAQIIEELKSQQ